MPAATRWDPPILFLPSAQVNLGRPHNRLDLKFWEELAQVVLAICSLAAVLLAFGHAFPFGN